MKKTLDQTLLENLASNLTDIWEDWNKVNHHDKTNGLSQKAVNAYRHEHPGSHLQTAVTTKPSKLKPGSKAAKRRKSFCARMSGNKGPMKKPNGKPTPKALALRRWHCESIEEMRQLIEYAEQEIAREKMLAEKWSQKYKSSINCSHPKGFSQKAHCAGKKKHEESMMTMETVCPDCGMCQTHGNLNEIKKGAKDSNGFTKCWPGHHAAGTKKGKNGGQVRNCVPNEGVAEAHDPKFAGFMNQALGTRQDKKPLRVDPKTVMSMNNMPGYKHAFKFGMDIIKKMDPDTKEHFANEDDDALESYMIDIAEKKGFIPKYFVEEDLSEVVGEFEEIFHDPEMEGWSWADLLRDMIGQEPRAHEKANVQAHKQMMAKAQAEKDNLPPIDPNKLQVVDRTDTGKSEIWYPSGGFFGTDSWAVVQDGFKDKAHAEHALKQLKANPNVVNIIKKAIEDENMSESTGDKPFDTMMKTIKKGTGKQATADRKEQKQRNQEQTRQAIDNMFGGGNPADKLSIRKKGVAENYHSDLMKQTYAKFFKPAPPKTVSAVKKFLSGVIISLGTAQDNDYDEEEPEEISWEQDLADVREAYSKLRGNSSPNWFDIADAVLSYDTEFRESMLEWAEEELGNELVDFLWHEVWEAKHKISRSSGSYNVTLGHQSVPGQQNDRDSFKDWDPETDPPNPFANLRWLVMINGEQKIKFGGVGNSQEAAMKTATNWANNHGYEREVQAGKVKVVKVQQGVAEGGGAQQAAIAIAKKESGKYTKDGKRKK